MSPDSPALEHYTSRPAVWEDIPAMVEIANAHVVDQSGHPEWTVEDVQFSLARPDYNISESMRIWSDASGTPVAIGLIMPLDNPPVRSRALPYILPHLPHFQEVGLEIMAWLESTVRQQTIPQCPEDAKVQMTAWTFATHAPTVALYEAYGMHKIRQFWSMEIALHDALPIAELPDGMTIRTLRYPEEGRLAYRMRDEAFADHYGHIDDPDMKNYDRWAHHRFEGKQFDPTLWFIAEVDGEPAGFAWCRLGMFDDPKVGWIDTLGVLPAFRRRGIADLLLRHAFRDFYKRDMHKAGLGVDATNITGATRVYERAGMHIAAKWDTYAKVLRDGVELTRE
jgi:mycothiol synthase